VKLESELQIATDGASRGAILARACQDAGLPDEPKSLHATLAREREAMRARIADLESQLSTEIEKRRLAIESAKGDKAWHEARIADLEKQLLIANVAKRQYMLAVDAIDLLPGEDLHVVIGHVSKELTAARRILTDCGIPSALSEKGLGLSERVKMLADRESECRDAKLALEKQLAPIDASGKTPGEMLYDAELDNMPPSFMNKPWSDKDQLFKRMKENAAQSVLAAFSHGIAAKALRQMRNRIVTKTLAEAADESNPGLLTDTSWVTEIIDSELAKLTPPTTA
jgi:hypothetical protein